MATVVTPPGKVVMAPPGSVVVIPPPGGMVVIGDRVIGADEVGIIPDVVLRLVVVLCPVK